MEQILLSKKEALRIAITILNKEKSHDDYGFTALKEAKLILKNIHETFEVEEQLLAEASVKLKPKPKRKKPNKKEVEANMAYFNQILGDMDESNKQGKTILDLEGGK